MCVDIIYKFPCGCRVSPVGAPHRQKCAKAAKTWKECWVATDQEDELWPGKEVCQQHGGKKAQRTPENPHTGGKAPQAMPDAKVTSEGLIGNSDSAAARQDKSLPIPQTSTAA